MSGSARDAIVRCRTKDWNVRNPSEAAMMRIRRGLVDERVPVTMMADGAADGRSGEEKMAEEINEGERDRERWSRLTPALGTTQSPVDV